MTVLLKCDYPDCTYSHALPQVLGKHKFNAHGIKGSSASNKYRRKKVEPTNGHVVSAAFKCSDCGEEFRTYQSLNSHRWRKHREVKGASQQVQQPATAAITLNYCPCCGTNLQLLASAMQAAGELANG